MSYTEKELKGLKLQLTYHKNLRLNLKQGETLSPRDEQYIILLTQTIALAEGRTVLESNGEDTEFSPAELPPSPQQTRALAIRFNK